MVPEYDVSVNFLPGDCVQVSSLVTQVTTTVGVAMDSFFFIISHNNVLVVSKLEWRQKGFEFNTIIGYIVRPYILKYNKHEIF